MKLKNYKGKGCYCLKLTIKEFDELKRNKSVTVSFRESVICVKLEVKG